MAAAHTAAAPNGIYTCWHSTQHQQGTCCDNLLQQLAASAADCVEQNLAAAASMRPAPDSRLHRSCMWQLHCQQESLEASLPDGQKQFHQQQQPQHNQKQAMLSVGFF
jgi:hypothetical protein